ncbi:MAG: transglutaminase domain-containing protein, partial [Thermomicrobiales bacterium]
DTFLTADRRFDVALSWRQVTDERYSMQGSSLSVVLGRLPVDLRSLGSMLYDVQFSPAIDPLTGLPVPTDARRAADILAEREELGRRFIQANWTLDPNGEIIDLVVSGQLPNYDDVEAVSTKSEIAEGSTYGVTGLTSSATPEDLRQAGSTYPTWVSDRYLGLPPSITDRTRTLATRVATGQETPFDVATATEAFVRQAIRYEEKIEAPPDGWDGVDYVLFESREGYCEYYASAMAVMLRTQGIPTRVVGGYYPAPYDAAEEGYLYREKNAHLWVEVFFPGLGWIPFEPTASQDRLDYNQDDPATTSTPTPQPSATPPAASPTAPPDAGASSESGPASAFFARASRHPGWWLGSFGISLGLAALFAVLIWSWRFRGLGPLSSVFARTLRLGRWVGVTTGPSTTPREYAEDLGRAAPVIRSSALLVSDLYGQEAYGGRRADPATVRRARTAWVEVRWGILRSVVRRRLRIKRGGKAIG